MALLTRESDHSMLMLLKGSKVDRLLLCVSLLAIVISWFVIQSRIAAGPAVAEIYHGQVLLATYPLPQPGEAAQRLHIEGELGTSEVLLDQEGVRIVSSPCTTQHCVQSGVHRHAGDMIACVPNRILITVRGKSASTYDAIVE
ncbi:hypothetical protein MMIC_P0623 [Mariprofundus micogutta]|uniref:Uncharacterized protein n=1 Tax=Mariprofundus micogutta TaxID=1921010 RepID=A0A1L8CL87_9PROT|nr:NusG domain II-containing protein [Mariprofundus micogutta]GAV19672.1 hypothetical protein MMIC_P0623 [Mariprofundus micogutta]